LPLASVSEVRGRPDSSTISTLAFGLVTVLWSLAVLTSGLETGATVLLLIGSLTAMVAAFAILTRKKTNDPWRWRWGKRGEKA